MVNDLSLLLKVLAHMQNRTFVKRSMKSDLSGSTLKILLKMNLKDSSLYMQSQYQTINNKFTNRS